MRFSVRYSNKSCDFFKKSELEIRKRVLNKIDNLLVNPFPNDVKSVKGKGLFRVRVGNYRILYEIEEDEIVIFKIEKRGNVYK